MTGNVDNRRYIKNSYVANVLLWMVILCMPYMLSYSPGTGNITFLDYILLLRLPVSVAMVFYVNYYILVDRFLVKERSWLFLGCNIILILACMVFERVTAFPLSWQKAMLAGPPAHGGMPPGPFMPAHFMFVNTVLYLCALGAAVAFRMTRQWYLEEERKKEREHNMTCTELQNLRSQLNPHFLFNTLNNIYSSIGTDSEHARRSMDRLCSLLRYALYRSDRYEVAFSEEVSFIRDYIELAKERMPEDADLSVSLPESPSDTPVAPMLFVTLVENAFKHGIKPGAGSFVHILLYETDGRIVCEVRNSFYGAEDPGKKCEGGIGLENLRKRLGIMYKDHYIYRCGAEDGREYCSYLEIDI